MRIDAAAVLISMGFAVDTDFVAFDNGNGTATVVWKSATTMPSAAAIAAYDMSASAVQARALAKAYAAAKALLTADDPLSKKEKAVLLEILGALNRQSRQFRDLIAAITAAGTTSFATLKAAVNAIAPVEPARTAQDLKDAVAVKIDAGLANG